MDGFRRARRGREEHVYVRHGSRNQNEPGPTVMIIDDAELSRQTLARLLRREGYQTLCADSGNQALHLLRQAEPDLILLDVKMPGLDGLDLLEMLHDNPQWRALPVVMLTAVADTHTVHRSLQLGAKAYLIKAAFSVGEMMTLVKQFTGYMPQ
jgi:CheY-like chemotaxis protein